MPQAEPTTEASGRDRFVATILFTDIVDSTPATAKLGDTAWHRVLDKHDALVRQVLLSYGGRETDTAGDSFLAVFEVPGQAVRCALELMERVPAETGLNIRAGVHAGELEHRGEKIGGLAVNIAARVIGAAASGEVLVTSTVRDLAAGSHLGFQSRGSHTLKGVPGRWRLYAASVLSEVEEARPAPAPAPATRKRATATTPSRRKPSRRLLLVDDHPMWRQTLRTVLEHAGAGTIVAEAANGGQAVALAAEHAPDVVVMDMDLPVLHGIEATKKILAHRPETRILVLSSSDEKQQVLAAIRAGATGYLLKTAAPAELADAVARTAAGELVVPAQLASVVVAGLREPEPIAKGDPVRVRVAGRTVLQREGLDRLCGEAGMLRTGPALSPPDLLETDLSDVEVLLLQTGGSADDDVERLRELRAACPHLGVLILAPTMHGELVAPLLEGSPRRLGCLLEERVKDVDSLADAVRRVAAGEPVIDPELVAALFSSSRRTTPLNDLTPREREVLALMAEGFSNPAIGEALFLGAKTVEGHVASIFSKLGLETDREANRRVQAVLAYLRAQA